MTETFEQAVEWLATLHRFGIKLGLEQTRTLCDLCGAPDRGLRFIHLAGTNGKGSTGAMLEKALRAQGLKTGFYSSPHLISPCERFRVNGCAVSEEEFAGTAGIVQQAVGKMRADGFSPTYFEATTVMAMLMFVQHKCDWVVWETGMGGRLDSTNIVQSQVSVITNIAIDHEKYLGSTIPAIAAEKAGIIKAGVPVVCGVMPDEAYEVIKKRAAELGSVLYPAAEVFPLHKHFEAQTSSGVQRFSCGEETVELQLKGVMQQRNTQTVATVLKVLQLWNPTAVKALKTVRWPGRIDLVCDGKFLVDGGHNPDGLAALFETLQTLYPGKKFRWLFGAFADKDFAGGLKMIAPLVERLDAVAFAEEARLSATPEDICHVAEKLNIKQTSCVKDLAAYLSDIRHNGSAEDSLPTVIAGSLYLAGEVLAILETPRRVLDL